MRKLFIALTDYQLINYINLKLNTFKAEHVDIIINNNKDGKFELAERLEKIGLFDEVYLYNEPKSLIHQYIKNFANGRRPHGLGKALKNDFGYCFKRCVSLFNNNNTINYGLWKNKKIDLSQYDQIVGIKTEKIVADCVKQARKLSKGKCKFSVIDEGTSSYINLGIDSDDDVSSVYLYNKDMALYKDKIKILGVPQISRDDSDLIRKLNYVFGFKELEVDLNGKTIFFDQPWEPMPEYLKDISGLKKILLKNAYKKHLKESVIYEQQMNIFKILVDNSPKNTVFVKLHPRSKKNVIDEYKKYGCRLLPSIDAPWELFGVNFRMDDGLWVTVNSSALCSYDFTISGYTNNHFVYGYKLNRKLKTQEEFDMDRFFVNYSKLNDKVKIPNSISELISIINDYYSRDKLNVR